MKAVIITIGNEILKGRTVNTNFSYIAKILTYSGYEVIKGIIIPDNLNEIAKAFKESFLEADLIVSSGGLGPTYDDMTLKGFSMAFGLKLEKNSDALNMVLNKVHDLTPEREKMAFIPENSTPIKNSAGVAPGIYTVISGKTFIILPGVPREVESVMEEIKERIKIKGFYYIDKSINLYNVKESLLAPLISKLMKEYGSMAYIKTHPKINEDGVPWVEVEVSASGNNKDDLEEYVSKILNTIEKEKNNYV
ncbi:molybdopterin-binding protein [Ferroplasma sp.]|uniref:molybdopterin-binding protein n=1 Tax=Ferroplasma sp. TaxID=2591003 RepID=UPI00307F49A8